MKLCLFGLVVEGDFIADILKNKVETFILEAAVKSIGTTIYLEYIKAHPKMQLKIKRGENNIIACMDQVLRSLF